MGVASTLPSWQPLWQNVEIPFLPQFTILDNVLVIQIAMLCVFVWGTGRLAIAYASPAWYKRLNNDATKRGFIIGAIIGLGFKFFTIPTCAVAAYVTPPQDDVAGIHPSMNVYQQMCWGSRGTVTILELMHFTSKRELVLHHVLILVGMSIIGHYNGPHRGFDLALGALVSEIPNSVFMIFKEFGLLLEHPNLEWVLPLFSAVLGFAFRVPAIILAMAMVPAAGLRGGHAIIMLIAYFFYLSYILNITWRRLKRARVWRMVGDRDFYLRLHSRFIISSTSFYTGLVTMGWQVLVLALAGFLTPATSLDLIDLAWVSVPGSMTALFLCCLMFPGGFFESTEEELLLSQRTRMIKLPGLSTIGRWVFMGWVLLITYHASLGDTPEVRNRRSSPADIVAQQPSFCGLVLSWQFWVCTTSVWASSTYFMFLIRDRSITETVEGEKEVLRNKS